MPSLERTVQIGYCTSVKNLGAAKGAGFDYVEPGTTELTSLSDAGRTIDD